MTISKYKLFVLDNLSRNSTELTLDFDSVEEIREYIFNNLDILDLEFYAVDNKGEEVTIPVETDLFLTEELDI